MHYLPGNAKNTEQMNQFLSLYLFRNFKEYIEMT
jgi:hypothetical protein